MENMEYIIWLSGQEESERSRNGSKAAGFARLLGAGLPVPKAFCVCAQAYEHHLRINGLWQNMATLIEKARAMPGEARQRSLAEIRDVITRAPMDAGVAEAIGRAYAALDTPAVAVRSSATAEDLPEHSFAGQYETFLGITSAPACIDAARRCWASLWTQRAFEYREKHGFSHHEARMAVVVQVLVPAETSGVLFTADPATGRRDRIIIEACFGLGEMLVSGKADPDRFVIIKERWNIIEHVIGNKKVECCLNGHGGIIEREVAGSRSGKVCLDEKSAVRLAKLAHKVETLFGAPQDIEWAIRDGRMYLLQSRPITALPAAQTWEDRQVWTNANTGEVLPDVITPLTWSFVQILVEAILKAMMGWVGVDFVKLPMVGLIGGRVYFNVNTTASVIRLLPGMRNQDIGKIFGGAQKGKASFNELAIPDEDIPDLHLNLLKVLLKTSVFAVSMLTRSGSKAVKLIAQMDKDAAAIHGRNLNAMSEEALMAQLTADLASMRTFVEGLALSGAGMFWFTHLDKICTRWFGDEGVTYANRLLAGSGGIASAESGLALWRLAVEAHAHPEVEGLLLGQGLWESIRRELQTLPAGRNFLASWETFMTHHGHHTRGELELFNLRWSETPDPILDTVREYVRAMDCFDALALYNMRASESKALAEQCRNRLRNPLKRTWFNLSLKHAKHGSLLRENIKSGAIRYWAGFRKTMLVIGQHLKERGALCNQDDIFFLHLEEVARLTDKRETLDFRESIAARRAEYERFRTLNPPDVVLGRWEPSQEVPEAPPPSMDIFHGIAVSPGVATGPARVILSAENQERVRPGEILVAPFTDPGWAPYFMTAAAIVMDRGGLLSHGSIVAREYGIPAVVNVGPATKSLRTGQMLEVDGNRGTVGLLKNPNREADKSEKPGLTREFTQ